MRLYPSAPDVYLDLLETLLVERNYELYKEPEVKRGCTKKACPSLSGIRYCDG